MNKKFSTLLAAAMVAGGMSAQAQISTSAVEDQLFTEPARNYMLNAGESNYVSVDGEIAKVGAVDASKINSQLWTIKVKNVAGSNRFILVNKVNGTTLSFDVKSAVVADKNAKVTAPADGSKAYSLVEVNSDTEWTWISAPNAKDEFKKGAALTFAFSADSTMSVAVEKGKVFAYKYANNNVPTVAGQLKLQAMKPGSVDMKAADLNVLGTGADKYFTLTTNKKGLIGAEALIGKQFTAVDAATGYVKLQLRGSKTAKGCKYAYVDTAFHVGTGTNENVWYKFGNSKEAGKHGALNNPNAFSFKFSRDLFKDSVTVSVPAEALKKYNETPGTGGSHWLDTNDQNTDYTTVSAVKLTENTEVLTLYSAPNKENLLFSVSSPEADATLTSVEDGVYFIKNEKGQYLAVPVYKGFEEFSGYPTWVTVNEDEQNPAHMPAYQWVILKDKTSDKAAKTSPVTLTNREFAKKLVFGGGNANLVDDNHSAVQLRKDADAEYFTSDASLFNGAESLAFEAVPAAALADSLLGYKNFDANELKVTRYTFNYLHPYATDKFIGKSAKDSLATVLDGKQAFAVEATGNIKDYGYDVKKAAGRIAGLKQLRRQAYQLYVPAKKDAYLSQNTESKYAITSHLDAATFYLKENNDLKGDNNCYHALIQIGNVLYGKNKVEVYSKAGVSDTEMSAVLKNQVASETRTSAFLVAPYDAPLYRRFNSEKLEGNVGDAADTLRFVEKYRNEYLQVENNKNFQVEGIKFLGIYTPDFTKDGKSFIVDTAFVNRWNGNIKPQYLISINRQDQAFAEGEMCPVCQEIVANGGTRPANCPHDKAGKLPFHFGEYLVNFADSVANAANDADYQWKGYTRAGFVKAAHQGDSLYILTGQFADMTVATFDAAKIEKAVKDKKYDKKYIVNLQGDAHKCVTWSMRFVDPENAANEVEEDRAFLLESLNADGNNIAPTNAQWLKMQNGCLVMSGTAGAESIFDQFTNADDALIFNVEQGNKKDLATENEVIATSEVTVIAGEGQLTIANAAGKRVVVSNILGQVVANTVLSSDNATIAAPQGVVVVAVEGEDAVKAIVK